MSAPTLLDGGSFTLTMDGRELSAEPGSTLLQVARAAGVSIPTLCDHPDLEPVGACRLCLVEVTHPDWGGWKGLMTACLYPASPGLEVSTASEAVRSTRRGVLSLLAARCPSSEAIQALARKHGATATGLYVDPGADDCILCGLCTRVCEAFATSAISTLHRGIKREIGSPFNQPPPDCIGCGACAKICPTGHIRDRRDPAGYSIWGRQFATAACAVIVGRCIGCGACEEACPFDVARVVVQRDGLRTARIPADPCRGCGACVGACPNGAIMQQGDPLPMPGQGPEEKSAAGKAAVAACSRSALGAAALPGAAEVAEVPCVGRITVNQMLRKIALGADGMLLLGRHEQTCRLDGAEGPARDRVSRVRELLELLGLGAERLRFASPDAGPDGPAREVRRFVDGLAASGHNPAAGDDPLPWTGEGLAGGLTLLQELSVRSGAGLQAGPYLERRGLPAWNKATGGWKLWAGDLPYLQLLGAHLWRPEPLDSLLGHAAAVLEVLFGEPGGVQVGPPGAEPGDAITLEGVEALMRERGGELPRPERPLAVACAGESEAALAVALGHRVIPVEPSPLAGAALTGPADRKAAGAYLAAAEAAGAEVLLAGSLDELVQWRLITRDGAWRSSRVRPVLGLQLAGEELR